MLEPLRRFFIFIFMVAELRPPLLYSAFNTTMGSLPTMITLPLLNSCAVFIFGSRLSFVWRVSPLPGGVERQLVVRSNAVLAGCNRKIAYYFSRLSAN